MKIPESVPWKRGKSLGAGGQGKVYEAIPLDSDRFGGGPYVLKELSRPDNAQALARFAREVETINSVNHPGVVRIIDHSKADDSYQFYVMPRYEGARSLAEVAFGADSPFRADAKATLRFIARCCSALYETHKQQIVHRDIKPANILVLPDLSPVIIDFGCCYVGGGGALTLTDEGVGAKDYMAPECETGADEDVTLRADIYSLGKVMWAMLTGQRAFARERPAYANKSLDTVLPHNPQCWHLTELLKQCIRRDPKNRYGNVDTLRKECERMSDELIGRLLPMELLERRCPLCGSDQVEVSKGRIKKPLVEVGLLLVNSRNHPDLTGSVCRRCGFVFLRNVQPHEEWAAERQRLRNE